MLGELGSTVLVGDDVGDNNGGGEMRERKGEQTAEARDDSERN